MFSALIVASLIGNAPVAYKSAQVIAPASQVAYLETRQQMLDDLNATRRKARLRPLVLETHLTGAAVQHASDMAAHGYFDHTSRDGRSPFDRMHAFGCRFGYAGENIALSDSEREAYAALLQSPEHLQNILNAHYTNVGIGVAAAPDGSLMFVQDFSD